MLDTNAQRRRQMFEPGLLPSSCSSARAGCQNQDFSPVKKPLMHFSLAARVVSLLYMGLDTPGLRERNSAVIDRELCSKTPISAK